MRRMKQCILTHYVEQGKDKVIKVFLCGAGV